MEEDLKSEPQSFGDYVTSWEGIFAKNFPKKKEGACPHL